MSFSWRLASLPSQKPFSFIRPQAMRQVYGLTLWLSVSTRSAHHSCKNMKPSDGFRVLGQHNGISSALRLQGTVCFHLNLGPEGIGVALQNGLHSGLADLLALLVVAAVDAVAVVAVAPAGEALAVQLQAA